MGHIHLVSIPNSRQWRVVVSLIDGGADSGAIIEAAAVAAENDLFDRRDDPVLVEATRLLAMIPQAARAADFKAALAELGIPTGDAPMLLDIVAAAGRRLDEHAGAAGVRSDFTEIVRGALVETIAAVVAADLPGLFGPDAGDVQAAVAKIGTSTRFSGAAREFFARVTRDGLAYYLSRELSAHVSAGGGFATVGDRSAFDGALDQHCREASRIIKEFSGGWYGKTLYERGAIGSVEARVFSAVALKKICAELRRSRGAGDA